MSQVNAHHIIGSTAVIVVNGRTFNITDTHPSWKVVIERLKKYDYTGLETLLDVRKSVEVFSNGLVKITDDGELTYNGTPLHSALAKRIVSDFKRGFDVSALVNFLDRVSANPSQTARDELYLWLETSKLPFTPDGHFLAYKKVREDYKDIYSGQFDHSIGTTLAMPRDKVDPNRNRTCSYGFHFCSLDYLNHYSSAVNDHVMIVKVDPANVVAIPSDYQNQKGRATGYTVVAEYKGWAPNAGVDWDEELQEVPDDEPTEVLRDWLVNVYAIDDQNKTYNVVIQVEAYNADDAEDEVVEMIESGTTETPLDEVSLDFFAFNDTVEKK